MDQIDALPADIRSHIFLIVLPCDSPGINALIVNAVQTASYCIVQNSLQEGYGLTLAEAMYKRAVVVGTQQAVGLRAQVSDGYDGVLTMVRVGRCPAQCHSSAPCTVSLPASHTHHTSSLRSPTPMYAPQHTQGDPSKAENVAASLKHVLGNKEMCAHLAQNAQHSAIEHSLMYRSAGQWFELLLTLRSASVSGH